MTFTPQKETITFYLVFLVIFVISFYLKLIPILNYNFPFTMDQARDMIDIREIVVSFHPSLIGPTTSINGVFLGPFYYYFNVLPFLFSSGNPAALVYWNILWYMTAGILLLQFFYKQDKYLGLISSTVFLMSPALFYSSRFFWSANPMPYVTVLYFLSLLLFISSKDKKTAFASGFISGLSMQFEAAFGILFFPFLIIYSLVKRVPIKKSLFAVIGFFVTLIPQALFELRHGFIMTKTFLNEVSGNSQILGEKLGFFDAQISHLKSFLEFNGGILEIPNYLSIGLTILSVVYLSKKYRQLTNFKKEVFVSSSLFIVFAFLFYSWYLHPLKGWYLLGLRIPYILIISLFLSEIFSKRNLVFKTFVVILLGYSFINTFFLQVAFVPKGDYRSGDKSNLGNEIEAIDWVYTKAAGEGFKAYNYIPSVYDYPYQYLYWWHGTKKYGYQPETVTYLDNVPEYIKENDKYLTKKKPAGNDPVIFLIYEKDENPQRLAAWLGNFTNYCSLEKKAYPWGTTVELRKLCKN